MRKKTLVALILSGALVGCGTTRPVVTEKTRYRSVPSTLTATCVIPEPPAIDAYLASTWQQKEDKLRKAMQAQINSLAACNSQLAGIRTWNAEQAQIYQDTPGQEVPK